MYQSTRCFPYIAESSERLCGFSFISRNISIQVVGHRIFILVIAVFSIHSEYIFVDVYDLLTRVPTSMCLRQEPLSGPDPENVANSKSYQTEPGAQI